MMRHLEEQVDAITVGGSAPPQRRGGRRRRLSDKATSEWRGVTRAVERLVAVQAVRGEEPLTESEVYGELLPAMHAYVDMVVEKRAAANYRADLLESMLLERTCSSLRKIDFHQPAVAIFSYLSIVVHGAVNDAGRQQDSATNGDGRNTARLRRTIQDRISFKESELGRSLTPHECEEIVVASLPPGTSERTRERLLTFGPRFLPLTSPERVGVAVTGPEELVAGEGRDPRLVSMLHAALLDLLPQVRRRYVATTPREADLALLRRQVMAISAAGAA